MDSEYKSVWAIGIPKKLKISKNIEKFTIQESCTKRYNFAPDAANHTFLTHPVYRRNTYEE